jgi:microcystin-dependent protein
MVPGMISMYGGQSAPQGFLMCNGAAVSRTTYAALFSAISTTYGAGDGSTTFLLPDFTNSFPRGNTASTGGGNDTHLHSTPNHAHGPGSLHAEVSALAGSGVVINRVATSAWTDNFADAGAVAGSSVSRSTGANVNGSTTTDGGDFTGFSSNVPFYTGVRFIIKT